MSTDVPAEFLGDEETELVPGREPPPFTQAPDWVSLSGISGMAAHLHRLLAMHINQRRGEKLVWPSTRSLAKMMGLPRRDKVAPFIAELVEVGAIDKNRRGVPARNVYVVHTMPPQGYAGPLTLADWYKQNRQALEEQAAKDKQDRDNRAAAARRPAGEKPDPHPFRPASNGGYRCAQDNCGAGRTAGVHKVDEQPRPSSEEPQVNPVTTDTGQLPVTTDTGQLVTTPARQPVATPTGRKQYEVEPDEENKQNPLADATAESEASAVQTTIDGKDEVLGKQDEAKRIRQLAGAIVAWWFEGWKGVGTPISGDTAEVRMRALVGAFLRSGYTEDEIKAACRRTAAPTVPSTDRLQRELAAVRGVGIPAARNTGGRVKDHWKRPQLVGAGATTAEEAPPRADRIQTEGAAW